MIPQIPLALQAEIKAFIVAACRRGERIWRNFAFEEDSITGAFLSKFETDVQYKKIDNQLWTWNVDYLKFRGRGPGAFENIHGSDGIFQIEVKNEFDKIIFSKGLLFQAKKVNGSLTDLKPQVQQMEKLVPNSSVAFIYGPEGFKATLGRDIVSQVTKKNSFMFEKDIANVLANDFLDCSVGKVGLIFDYGQGKLFVIDEFGLSKRMIGLQRPKENVIIEIQRLR